MLTKTETIANIEITPDGAVNVTKNVQIMDGALIVAQSGSRERIAPGQDYSGHPERVRSVCAAVHTQECIAEYVAATGQQGA